MKAIIKILLRTVGASLIQNVITVLFEVVRERLPKMKRDHAEIINAALPLLENELKEESAKEIAKRL